MFSEACAILFTIGLMATRSLSGSINLLFCKFLAKNCMKMKEFGPRGGARVPGAPLDPPCLNIHAENWKLDRERWDLVPGAPAIGLLVIKIYVLGEGGNCNIRNL